MNVINQKLALEKLNNGLPIIFQTDTLPAIGCLPKFSEIIYKTKKRDKNKPLILMGAETNQLQEFVHQSALQDYKSISSKESNRFSISHLGTVIQEKKLLIYQSNNLIIDLNIKDLKNIYKNAIYKKISK